MLIIEDMSDNSMVYSSSETDCYIDSMSYSDMTSDEEVMQQLETRGLNIVE